MVLDRSFNLFSYYLKIQVLKFMANKCTDYLRGGNGRRRSDRRKVHTHAVKHIWLIGYRTPK